MKLFRIFDFMKKERMQISFDGQSHQIDANVLVNTLVHYTSVVQQANMELSGGARNVGIQVNALKEGSFVIDICLTESIKSLFSADTIGYLAGLTTVVTGVFQIYKRFKGKPISESDLRDFQFNINNNKGNITINHVTNIYNDRIVRTAISKSIEAAKEETNIEGITLSTDKGESVTFHQSEFADLIYTDFDNEDKRPDELVEYVDTTLVITGLKFEKGGRWNFVYNGFKISMVVKDDALMQEIDNGARFGKGDSIRVKMKILKKYNPDYNVYENKNYKIVEFYEHIVGQPNTQRNIF